MSKYEHKHGKLPPIQGKPMEENDSPELDMTEELGADGITEYQSMIGELQWCVTLGRMDIFPCVMTMSRFRVAPRKGHIERLTNAYGYLRKHPDRAIWFRTGIPDHEEQCTPEVYDWMETIYAGAYEEIPKDAPEPKGKFVRTTSYKDANLLHCKVTGRSATGIIHFLNQTPVQWFSKRQTTVETATYGSEFVAARQCTEQIMDLRLTLMYMGVPIDGPSWMFGDNLSVIKNATLPTSVLLKRHNFLCFHRVREAIAANIIRFIKINGKDNIADILTKFLPWAKLGPMIEPLLFQKGETMNMTAAAHLLKFRGVSNSALEATSKELMLEVRALSNLWKKERELMNE